MEQWKEYKLEELSKDKGTYGIAASAVPYDPNKFTYLRITDINDDGTLNHEGLMSVDEPNASDYLLCKNDLVFARTGNSTGRTYFYQGTECSEEPESVAGTRTECIQLFAGLWCFSQPDQECGRYG